MNELLFEIGTEEIPAGYIGPALRFMARAMEDRLAALHLGHGKIQTAGTPRRLTLAVNDLDPAQPDSRKEHIGPPKAAGFDDQGQPTKAALGFARSKGVDVEELRIVTTAKGEYLMVEEEVAGRKTASLLPDLLAGLIAEIPFPKSMRWADTSMAFARPIQWLLALYDGNILPVAVESIQAGDQTAGHRFMAPEQIRVSGFTDYLQKLEERFVVADPDRRRQLVISQVQDAVKSRSGANQGQPLLDDSLVDTVTNLVEIPWGVCGSFDDRFLALPAEVLVTSMREHQKYFPVQDNEGRLLPYFVAVNNTRVADRELASSGHERVLRARLEDAFFFFSEDRKTRLADRVDQLSGIIFQRRLGTMAAKTERIVRLAGQLADQLAPEQKDQVERAALLAKADLLTEMVGEFPSLQGVIGREYALLDGEPPEVAQAIHEHYLPVRAGDSLPGSIIGALVGLADRMDTMVGCFAIGERPTGNKDAFGQRRLALGMIHIILGLDLSLSLRMMATTALEGYGDALEAAEDTVDELLRFIRLRFENDLVSSGLKQDVVEAATRVRCDDLTDCLARIRALEAIATREEFAILAGAFKRIRNITKELPAGGSIDPDLLREDAEKDLHVVVSRVGAEVEPLLRRGAYDEALAVLLQMKQPVDTFFDEVMVMCDDPSLRRNRLNLLIALRSLVLQIGDISRMHHTG